MPRKLRVEYPGAMYHPPSPRLRRDGRDKPWQNPIGYTPERHCSGVDANGVLHTSPGQRPGFIAALFHCRPTACQRAGERRRVLLRSPSLQLSPHSFLAGREGICVGTNASAWG